MRKILPLNPCDSFETSFFFWIRAYLRHKMITLSTRLVYDKNAYKSYVNEILEIENMQSMQTMYRKLLKINFYNISCYYLATKKLYEFLLPLKIARLEEIDEDYLNEFLMLQNLSNATKKTYRKTLLNFFKFIERKNKDNFTFGFEMKVKNIVSSNIKLPRYLQLHELQTLRESIKQNAPTTSDSLNKNLLKARNNLVLSLLIFGGIRSCEVSMLNMNDIKEVDDYYIISIYGKCAKYRNIAIEKSQIENEINTYLAIRAKVAIPHFKRLFFSKQGKILSHHAIYRIVRKTFENNNLLGSQKNGAHTLRHSYASLIYKESNNLLLLQQILGHSSIETTKIYTHLDESILTNATQYLRAIG